MPRRDDMTCYCGKPIEPTPDLDPVLRSLGCSSCIDGMCRSCKEITIKSREVKCKKCGSLVGCDCALLKGDNQMSQGTDGPAGAANVQEVKDQNAKLFEANKGLTDDLDLAHDEFKRIASCPGVADEIKGLAERGQMKLTQHVPVITQRDAALQRAKEARVEIEDLRTKLEKVTPARDELRGQVAAMRVALDLRDVVLSTDAGRRECDVLVAARAVVKGIPSLSPLKYEVVWEKFVEAVKCLDGGKELPPKRVAATTEAVKRAVGRAGDPVSDDFVEVVGGGFTQEELNEIAARTAKKGTCQTCGNDKGLPRVDNGLSAGCHCQSCWTKMVEECRKRSW